MKELRGPGWGILKIVIDLFYKILALILAFKGFSFTLTHLNQMNFPISVVGRMSLFQILGVFGGIFFISIQILI